MPLINLFPTPIWKESTTQENFNAVNTEVENALKYIEDNDDLSDVSYIYQEAAKRKREAYKGDEGYFINDDLIGKHHMINLKQRIYQCLKNYVECVSWTPLSSNPNSVIPKLDVNGNFKILNSWFNLGKPGVMHEYHCHPGYVIAGVYYHRVSADHGGLCFNNPNQMIYSGGFPEGRCSPQNIELIPNVGDIILFPAWLQHGTMTNVADTNRISIAFNINFIPPNK